VYQLSDIIQLQKRLGVSFQNNSLLELALVHSSYINENPDFGTDSNEKIEFLGDAVLGLIIAEKLYQDFPLSSEGDLTRLRSALVRKETLAQIARKIGLGDYLFLGKGEEACGGRDKALNLAGAFEAVVAAIYLDLGLEKSRQFVLEQFGQEIHLKAHRGAEEDYKSRLQELTQAKWQLTPIYSLIEAVGPDHDKLFSVEVKTGNNVLGKGSGKSKKSAEMEAAKSALEGFEVEK
jgi:ribonuclease-3